MFSYLAKIVIDAIVKIGIIVYLVLFVNFADFANEVDAAAAL